MNIYGARGSYPNVRLDNRRFGGNSTCLHFRTSSGNNLVLDGGSGIRPLGLKMMENDWMESAILVSHTHWDHILGYPHFKPFRKKDGHFTFFSAGNQDTSFKDIFNTLYSDFNFPLSSSWLSASVEFREIPVRSELIWKDTVLKTMKLDHPGTTLAWRLEADGSSVAVCTDCARPRKAMVTDDLGSVDDYERELVSFCSDADVLVYDSHFFEHEIIGKEHWGHSTFEDAVRMARECGVRELVLFHHAPEHSDAQVAAKLAMAKDIARHDPLIILAASEGLILTIGEISK